MNSINKKCLAITGMPRSGTTLTCHLLNKLDNVIALHEPMRPGVDLSGLNRNEIFERVQSFFIGSRNSLLTEGKAITKHRAGIVPDNPIIKEDRLKAFARMIGIRIKRKSNLDKGEVYFDKNLDEEFILAIKHPPLFTGLLPEINTYFKTFAIVRNPLSVLLSWNSVIFPVSKGRSPTAELIDTHLKEMLNNEPDPFERQGILLKWFLHRYTSGLPTEQIIHYEQIISSNGKELSRLGLNVDNLDERLENKNLNKEYDRKIVEKVFDVIKRNYVNDFEELYPMTEIVALRDKLIKS